MLVYNVQRVLVWALVLTGGCALVVLRMECMCTDGQGTDAEHGKSAIEGDGAGVGTVIDETSAPPTVR